MENTPQMQPTGSNKGLLTVLIILVLILIVLVSYFGIKLTNKMDSDAVVSESSIDRFDSVDNDLGTTVTENGTSPGTPDSVMQHSAVPDGMKLYVNSALGYSFQYPSFWNLTTADGAGGSLVVSAVNPNQAGDLSQEQVRVEVSFPMGDFDGEITIDSIVDRDFRGKKYSNGLDVYGISAPLTISGQKAYSIVRNETDGGRVYFLLNPSNGAVYTVSTGHTQNPLAQTILDSFKLTN